MSLAEIIGLILLLFAVGCLSNIDDSLKIIAVAFASAARFETEQAEAKDEERVA